MRSKNVKRKTQNLKSIFTFYVLRFALFLSLSLLPTAPALAANVQFSCWCQDTTSLTCNHHLVDSGIEQTDTFWTRAGIGLSSGPAGIVMEGTSYGVDALLEQADLATRRETISHSCIDRCRADGGKTAHRFETSYREEICQECAADPASSCTEAQGARRWSATHATSSLAVLPQCPTEVTSVFPVQLGVPIGGVHEVNGIAEYINIGYHYLVTVVLTVAIIMVVWGGSKYLLGASMSSIQHGKETIKDALIGMVLVLGAYTILSTVNPATTILKLPSIERVACRNLDIPPAVASNRCDEDSDCASGNHCVETQFVFRTDTDQVVGSVIRTATGAGEEAGTAILGDNVVGRIAGGALGYAGFMGGAAGAGIWSIFNIGGHIKACSTGEGGAPCDSSQDCRPGLYCLTNWNLCSKKQNLPKGAPCGPLDGTGTIINGDTTCASGFECIPADRSIFTPTAISLSEGDYATCRGRVAPMLDITVYSNNHSRVPNDYLCTSASDCGTTGFDCIGPANPFRGKFCAGDVNHEPTIRALTTPCLVTSARSVTHPRGCNGGSGDEFTCVYCPATASAGGVRNWTELSGDAAKTQIGVCYEKSALSTPTRCGY